jgi:hypothetical protein
VPHLTRDWLLAVRIVWWYIAFRILKHVTPMATLVRLAKLRPVGPRRPQQERRIAHLVNRVGGLWGFGRAPTCLERSLVLYRLLSEVNASPRLMIGVAAGAWAVEGHAWVVVDGRPIGDSEDVVRQYSVVTGFEADGQVMPATS